MFEFQLEARKVLY